MQTLGSILPRSLKPPKTAFSLEKYAKSTKERRSRIETAMYNQSVKTHICHALLWFKPTYVVTLKYLISIMSAVPSSHVISTKYYWKISQKTPHSSCAYQPVMCLTPVCNAVQSNKHAATSLCSVQQTKREILTLWDNEYSWNNNARTEKWCNQSFESSPIYSKLYSIFSDISWAKSTVNQATSQMVDQEVLCGN